MQKVFLGLLVTMVPLSVVSALLSWSVGLQFTFCCLGIIALASYMGRATESLAIVAGPRIGGLLNATFGNAVELIISIFAIQAGMYQVVLASLTGSILGNLLLVGGLSVFVGGVKYKRQTINKFDARHNSSMLFFSVALAFVIPQVFSMHLKHAQSMTLSVGISVVLIVMYLAALFFKLVTHRGVYDIKGEEGHEEETAEWSKKKALLVLIFATLAVAFLSERLVHTIEDVAHSLGWSELFIGVIIVAIVGNAAEHASAVVMAYKNKMDVAVEIAVGSTLQIAMFVVPVLVIVSLFYGSGMALVFSLPELVAMIASVFLISKIVSDGDTNWLEGAMLLGAYIIVGIGFYLI